MGKIKRLGFDPERAAEIEVTQTLGITKTTLARWRRDGCPHDTSGNNIAYSIPAVVQWRIAKADKSNTPKAPSKAINETERRGRAAATLDEIMTDSSASSVARVQAAKVLLGIEESEKKEAENTVISFIEIENINDVIMATAAVCPQCGFHLRPESEDHGE